MTKTIPYLTNTITLANQPKPIGWFTFNNVKWAIYQKHPNFFHRFMVKLCFGINYEKCKSND
jgi:hypothetical protein